MTTFMAPPPAATFLAFYPPDNNIIAIGREEDSSIQIYNVRIGKVSIKRESIIPCFHESQSIGKTHYIWFSLEMQ